MNDAEYREWLKAHTAAFPGIIDWMKRQGTDSAAEISRSWKECLGDVGKDDALAATRLMNLGEETAPTGFGDHARAVRKISRRLHFAEKEAKQRGHKVAYIGGGRVFDCKWCQDTGWVMVVNIWRRANGGRPLKPFWDGKTRHLPQCAIECSCVRGERFNPETMFIVDPNESVEARASRFEQWWSEGKHLGSRVAAFDQWNQST